MGCPDGNVLAAFLHGSLPEHVAEETELHLSECDTCRAVLLGAARETTPPAAAALPGPVERGSTVGRYLVLERIGAGGMGVVVAAHDRELDRKIALKLIRLDAKASHPELHARLLREAQAMAKLAHPNVLAVHDVGTINTSANAGSTDEQLFIAMELAPAGNLTRWLAERPRPWREIVRAFAAAGRGLAAAHAAGLVHRDFKPDNVLVGAEGRMQVTDFGLAQSAGSLEDPAREDGEASPALTKLTRTGTFVGTPAFMAPEQLRREAATARSDQFSFCVALYVALYGQPPFAGKSLPELKLSVENGRIQPAPSRGIPRRLHQAIIRGLAVRPEDRHPSMDALLAVLEHDPRRPWWLAAGGAAVVAAAGVVAVVLGTRPATVPACSGAQRDLDGIWDATVKQRIERSFTATGRPYAKDVFRTVSGSLDGYTTAWAKVHTQACEATAVHKQQSPQLLDLRMTCLQRRRDELHALTTLLGGPADPVVLDKAVSAAGALRDLALCSDADALTAAIPPPTDPSVRAQVAEARGHLAEAEALLRAGKAQAGLPIAVAAADTARGLAYAPLSVEVTYVQAMLERETGDLRAAEATMRQAVSAAARARDDHHLALAWINMIEVLRQAGRYPDARALELVADAALVRDGDDARLRAMLLGYLGKTADLQADYTAAHTYLESALSIQRGRQRPDDPDVAELVNALGGLANSEGKFEEAKKLALESLAIYQLSLGAEHPKVVGILSNLGRLARIGGRTDEARTYYQRALTISEATIGPEHPSTASYMNNLGAVATDAEDWVEARRQCERALAIREKVLGPAHRDVGNTLINLALVEMNEGKHAAARERLARAEAILVKAGGPEHPTVAFVAQIRGDVEAAEGDNVAALRDHERALAIRRKALGPTHILVAESQGAVGLDQLNQGQADKALVSLEAARVIAEGAGADNVAIDTILVGLGEAFLAKSDAAHALPHLERALKIRETRGGAPALIAAARFAVARALWPSAAARPRALVLARQARDGYGPRPDAKAVGAWLKTRE
jgi:eukaryotic-like serine/threonine-protein kinase